MRIRISHGILLINLCRWSARLNMFYPNHSWAGKYMHEYAASQCTPGLLYSIFNNLRPHWIFFFKSVEMTSYKMLHGYVAMRTRFIPRLMRTIHILLCVCLVKGHFTYIHQYYVTDESAVIVPLPAFIRIFQSRSKCIRITFVCPSASEATLNDTNEHITWILHNSWEVLCHSWILKETRCYSFVGLCWNSGMRDRKRSVLTWGAESFASSRYNNIRHSVWNVVMVKIVVPIHGWKCGRPLLIGALQVLMRTGLIGTPNTGKTVFLPEKENSRVDAIYTSTWGQCVMNV